METRTVIDTHSRTTRNESVTRWSRGARAMLGAITFVLIAAFATVAASMLVGADPSSMPVAGMRPLHVVLFTATFAQFLLITFYLSFAAQNPRTDNRGAWMAWMILLPFAALPVYWWVHVWNAPFVGDPHHDYNVPGGQMTPQAD